MLSKEPEIKADFSRAPMAHANKRMGKQKKVARYLPNPEPNWGPKTKHGRAIKERKLKPKKGEEGDNDMAVDNNTNGGQQQQQQQGVDETGYDSTLS